MVPMAVLWRPRLPRGGDLLRAGGQPYSFLLMDRASAGREDPLQLAIWDQKLTAADVARELEVSERTARRDFDALAMAGVPVYSVQGRGGGWRLVGGARTDLSAYGPM